MRLEPNGAGLRIDAIVARLGGTLQGDGARVVDGIAPIERAGARDVAFLTQAAGAARLQGCAAGCVILPPGVDYASAGLPSAIVAGDPYLYYARLAQWFAERNAPARTPGVHPSAVVDAAARVHPDASVGPGVVVEEGATIAAGAVIGASSFVGRDAEIGAGTIVHPRVVIQHGCKIGARCILHPGAVIGADGFGFARDEHGAGVKIPQTGRVCIGDDVEIGANTTVDRGALDDTIIGDGVKIDNLVQVAHNVRIGEHTAIAGCVGISGSARIGAYCLIGGGVGIAGHLEIADHVIVGGMSLVSRSIRKRGHYTGAFPLDTHQNWSENAATLRHLAQLRDRIRRLETMVADQQTSEQNETP